MLKSYVDRYSADEHYIQALGMFARSFVLGFMVFSGKMEMIRLLSVLFEVNREIKKYFSHFFALLVEANAG